ncbi:MAG: ABC transporter permease subunit [Actinobacteria bacterium]|nr:ABC transporter permease subunit [Actinomycetota bacterium]
MSILKRTCSDISRPWSHVSVRRNAAGNSWIAVVIPSRTCSALFPSVSGNSKGKTFLSSVVDLPLAILTLVTGVMLSVLYGPASPFGGLLERYGIQVIFAVPGIILALLFVTLPFVIRTVQPVLSELDIGEEEASYLLGAGGWTTFRRVILPAITPAICGRGNACLCTRHR